MIEIEIKHPTYAGMLRNPNYIMDPTLEYQNRGYGIEQRDNGGKIR